MNAPPSRIRNIFAEMWRYGLAKHGSHGHGGGIDAGLPIEMEIALRVVKVIADGQ